MKRKVTKTLKVWVKPQAEDTLLQYGTLHGINEERKERSLFNSEYVEATVTYEVVAPERVVKVSESELEDLINAHRTGVMNLSRIERFNYEKLSAYLTRKLFGNKEGGI